MDLLRDIKLGGCRRDVKACVGNSIGVGDKIFGCCLLGNFQQPLLCAFQFSSSVDDIFFWNRSKIDDEGCFTVVKLFHFQVTFGIVRPSKGPQCFFVNIAFSYSIIVVNLERYPFQTYLYIGNFGVGKLFGVFTSLLFKE